VGSVGAQQVSVIGWLIVGDFEGPNNCSSIFQGDTGAQGLPGPPGEDGERVSFVVRAGTGPRRSLEGKVALPCPLSPGR
jgi:hypothetical protein